MSGKGFDSPIALPVEVLASGQGPKDVIKSKISPDYDEPFYVADIGRIVRLYQVWLSNFPTIKPFYAVKCNNDPMLLKTLSQLGAGFDCASKAEIKTILDLGVSTERIIYANPCKQISHLKYAAKKSVAVMTLDNELELKKIAAHYPKAKLVVRIRADDPNAIVQLGVKFGCSVPEACDMLNMARKMQLTVIGVSFHVGSGCQTPDAFRLALEKAYQVFQYADSIGYCFSLLDIGGGFPGSQNEQQSLLPAITSTINSTIDRLFTVNYPSLNIIAEPGRFFGSSPFTLAVGITGKRTCQAVVVGQEDGRKERFMYYLNDGVYGSFNCIMFDHAVVTPRPLQDHSSPALLSSLWGPTCDSADKICDVLLPELCVGDWLYVEEMGAYTFSAHSDFNGFNQPGVHYYIKEEDRELFDEYCTACVVEHTTVPHNYSPPSPLPVVLPSQELVACC